MRTGDAKRESMQKLFAVAKDDEVLLHDLDEHFGNPISTDEVANMMFAAKARSYDN